LRLLRLELGTELNGRQARLLYFWPGPNRNVAPEPAAAVCPPDSDLGCVTPRFQPEQLGGGMVPSSEKKDDDFKERGVKFTAVWMRSRGLGLQTFYM